MILLHWIYSCESLWTDAAYGTSQALFRTVRRRLKGKTKELNAWIFHTLHCQGLWYRSPRITLTHLIWIFGKNLNLFHFSFINTFYLRQLKLLDKLCFPRSSSFLEKPLLYISLWLKTAIHFRKYGHSDLKLKECVWQQFDPNTYHAVHSSNMLTLQRPSKPGLKGF